MVVGLKRGHGYVRTFPRLPEKALRVLTGIKPVAFVLLSFESTYVRMYVST